MNKSWATDCQADRDLRDYLGQPPHLQMETMKRVSEKLAIKQFRERKFLLHWKKSQRCILMRRILL